MTAIVGVLNSQGIAIAADSAVTVSGNNGKKVYNRSNKIFTLSKFHPIGIAIYNNADYMGIPLETLIKMYRKSLKDTAYDTVEQYKSDFLAFLKDQLANVSLDLKNKSFFSFCFESYTAIINNSLNILKGRNEELGTLEQAAKNEVYNAIISDELRKYFTLVDGYPKANYVDISFEDYCLHYSSGLNEIIEYIQAEIQKSFADLVLGDGHKNTIRTILFTLINIEFIFEKYCGLVFIGFGEKEIYPSSHLVLVGNPIANIPRIRIFDAIEINPGSLDSNILPYAQGDVTTTVLTGVDPNYKSEVKESIKSSFNTVANEIEAILSNPIQAQQIRSTLDVISNELIQKLEQYQYNKITGPLLEILAHMGKEDMSELAESLVNITSLKRKFTSSDSSDESVGGPVDVAIITKGDGFIWMKRKHYFNIEDNPSFNDRYFKF